MSMRIHLLGIGGTAMGSLAAMLKDQGHFVSGSDQNLYPPMSEKLKEWRIPVSGFSVKNLRGVHLCIIGNAVSRGNIELEGLLNKKLNYMSMPQALWHFFLKGKEIIVPVGTHGKTTMSFLLDHILHSAGLQNSFFAGGVRADGMIGFRLGEGPHFVIEGDEYDTAFFDKAPKFLHYRPRYLLINAIEYDHADIYPDFDSYKLAFRRLLRTVPSEGLVVGCKDNAGVRSILKDYKHSPIIYHSLSSAIGSPPSKKGQLLFQINGKSFDLSFIKHLNNFALGGMHNQTNALSVSLLLLYLGLPLSKIKRGLESFPGVLRRQQIRLDIPIKKMDMKRMGKRRIEQTSGIVFVEDFAHHPTAVKAVLAAMRAFYPKRRLHVFFEPRSATSRRSVFQKLYVNDFHRADFVYLSEIFHLEKVRAQERLNVRKMVKEINSFKKTTARPKAYYGKTPQDLFAAFQKHFRPSPQGDVVLALSNGNFGGIYPQLESFLSSL